MIFIINKSRFKFCINNFGWNKFFFLFNPGYLILISEFNFKRIMNIFLIKISELICLFCYFHFLLIFTCYFSIKFLQIICVLYNFRTHIILRRIFFWRIILITTSTAFVKTFIKSICLWQSNKNWTHIENDVRYHKIKDEIFKGPQFDNKHDLELEN